MGGARCAPMEMPYDTIVIGAGLGGLTAANRLGRFGRKVLLLEQHHTPGGLATWFKRKGHIFDVALHGFPYGMVKTCRKYWSRAIAGRIVQLKRIRFENPQFRLETTYDRDDFIRILTGPFGIPERTVTAFFETVRGMNFYDDQGKTTRELLEEFFPGRSDVVRLLMEPITYANGSTLDEPAITYGIVFSNFMDRGVFTFEGGTDGMMRQMLEELEANGVEVRLRAPVERILTEEGRAAGVVVGGETIRARSIISNANLKATVLDLAGTEVLPRDFAELTRKTRLSNSSCQVYIGIREGETLPEVGDLIFDSSAPAFDADALCAPDPTSRTFSLYYPRTRPGHGRCSIVASMNARYEDWADLTGAAYETAKESIVENALVALERYLPNIRDIADHVEAATPRTFRRYTGHWNGASFGSKFEGLRVSEDLPKMVPGLYHTGSTAIIMSGWLGAANYGVIVANQVETSLEGQDG